MTFDWTINVGSMVMTGGAIVTGVRVLLSMRDTIRDLTRVVGQAYPPTGLIGEVHEMKMRVETHHEWLVRSGLDRPTSDDRRAEV